MMTIIVGHEDDKNRSIGPGRSPIGGPRCDCNARAAWTNRFRPLPCRYPAHEPWAP